MATVIDYAWSGPSPQQIKAAGHEGVMRYISHDGGKDLSAAERDGLRALDLTIGLVFETTANRAAEGSAAGAIDAQYANQRADSLGYPLACTLWYAVDFDAQIGQVAPYFQGIASVGLRPFAPYGSYAVCEGIPCNGAPWQTVAWSRGKVSGRAGLLQNQFANQYDINKVLKANYGQWTTQPQSPGDDVLTDEEHNMLSTIRNSVVNQEERGTITHSEGLLLVQAVQEGNDLLRQLLAKP